MWDCMGLKPSETEDPQMSQTHTELLRHVHLSLVPTLVTRNSVLRGSPPVSLFFALVLTSLPVSSCFVCCSNHSLACPAVHGGIIFSSIIPRAKHGIVPELRGKG